MTTVAELVFEANRDELFAKELEIAETLELSTSTWRKGDPTRTIYYTLAVLFEIHEGDVADFIRGAFLDTAEGDWAYVKAEQDYGVTASPADFAACTGTLTNAGLLSFPLDPGDLIVANSSTGKTFRNRDALQLDPSGVLTDVTIVADEAGSLSTSGVGDIDTMVSAFAGVTFVNTTTAIGNDIESVDNIKSRARLKPASLSPNGPSQAYAYVALTPSLNGGANITKVRVNDDSTTGHVSMFLGNASGAPSTGDRDLVRDACAINCVPLCITPSINNAVEQLQDITYTAWIYDRASLTVQEVKDLIAAALAKLFLDLPIGGDVIPPAISGSLYVSDIIGTIKGAHPDIFRVTLATPAADVPATDLSYVFKIGLLTGTVNVVESP